MINVKPKELTVSKPSQPISKTLKIFFIIVQMIFSYDFGFVKYKSTRHKCVIKLCSAILSAILGVALIIRLGQEEETVLVFWYSIPIFLNYLFIVTLLIVPERGTFCSFLEHLLTIDTEVNANNAFYYFNVKIYIWCVASAACNVLLTIIYCSFLDICLKNVTTQLMFMIHSLSMEIPLVILYFVFHATYIRLVALRKFMNDNKFEPKQTQSLYKSLSGSIVNIKQAFDPIFIVALLVNIPSVMIMIYGIIRDTKAGLKNSLKYSIESIMAFKLFATIFAPAIAAGSLSTEIDKIKVTLHDMLIIEEGESQIKDIKKFISYLEARPLKFRVLKIIPLDATLPIVVLNICVTYLIVILQLTHIY